MVSGQCKTYGLFWSIKTMIQMFMTLTVVKVKEKIDRNKLCIMNFSNNEILKEFLWFHWGHMTN